MREEEERDQDGRGNRPQELDRNPERAPGQLARAEQDPDRHGEHRRDRQAESPSAHRVGEVLPELAGLHQRPELLHRGAHRRQVVLRDQPGAHDDLPEHECAGHGCQRQEDVDGRRRPGGARRHAPFRDHRAARDLPSDDHCVLYIARDVEYPRHRSSSRDRTANAVPRASGAPHAPGSSSSSRSSCSARTCERCSRACRRCSKTCVPTSGSRRPPRAC